MPPVSRSTWVRATTLLILLLIALGAAASVDLPNVGTVRAWLDEVGPGAWFAIALGQAVALMTPVPRSVLSVLVGAVAGFSAGLALVVIGGVLGGLAGYALSRSLGRQALVRLAGPRLARLDDLLGRRGFVAVLIARVMPVVPFMLVSYAAGLSGVRLAPYTLGTAVGVVPGSVLYVGIGASVALFTSWTAAAPLALLVIAAVTALLWWRRDRAALVGSGAATSGSGHGP